MGLKDFINKVRVLIEGDDEQEEYDPSRIPATQRTSRSSASGSSSVVNRIVSGDADRYDDRDDIDDSYDFLSDDDDGGCYDDNDSYCDKNTYIDDEFRYGGDEEDIDNINTPTKPFDASLIRAAYGVIKSENDIANSAYTNAGDDDDDLTSYPEFTPVREEIRFPQEQSSEPLPNRTEVALREVKRLSEKLDEASLKEYQLRLVQIKKETGAVSALTALRLIHEFVEDDEPVQVDPSTLPDLSAK